MTNDEYSLAVEPREGYLYVRASGARTRQTVSAIAFRAADAAAAHGLSRILVDVRNLEGRLGAVDALEVVTEVFRKLRGRGLHQTAVLDVPRAGRPEALLEVMARNRGFNLMIFSDETAALSWLQNPSG